MFLLWDIRETWSHTALKIGVCLISPVINLFLCIQVTAQSLSIPGLGIKGDPKCMVISGCSADLRAQEQMLPNAAQPSQSSLYFQDGKSYEEMKNSLGDVSALSEITVVSDYWTR